MKFKKRVVSLTGAIFSVRWDNTFSNTEYHRGFILKQYYWPTSAKKLSNVLFFGSRSSGLTLKQNLWWFEFVQSSDADLLDCPMTSLNKLLWMITMIDNCNYCE